MKIHLPQLFVSVLFLTVSVMSQAQTITPVEHIKAMKNGTLLVRLHTKENSILMMEVQGQQDRADKTYRKQLETNKSIMTSFKNTFDFAPVLFFFSYDSEKISNKNFNDVFVNEDFKIDPNIQIRDTSNIYIIDVGEVYFSRFGSHMKGIVILDDQFNSLPDEMPVIVRKRDAIALFRRSYPDMIIELNENLTQYYNERY
ncbi:hypothetical protein [Salibacter sp.]|uniref:hypothetical protein n=1 Tax=Salibacter sp. TaxID=2010995 RepID=UPI002870356B|nr:hypothetical protein [Salibacter sp.]MDR9398397.1 hypothetical protein [Salibacter sp.]MDR9487397.1 hypothetical protein [Salibacter sp.]